MAESHEGKVEITNSAGAVNISLNGVTGAARIGGATKGTLTVARAGGVLVGSLSSTGQLNLGTPAGDGGGTAGRIDVRDKAGATRVGVRGSTGEFVTMSADATAVGRWRGAKLTLGGTAQAGEVSLRDVAGVSRIQLEPAQNRLRIRDDQNHVVVELGPHGNLTAGGGGHDGDVILKDGGGTKRIHLDAQRSSIEVFDAAGKTRVHVDGTAGDIIFHNADCAEEFTAAEQAAEVPGTVVVLAVGGAIRPCRSEYDTRVAGVVSGAGRFRPAMVLDRAEGEEDRAPVAMLGKVACLADARLAPINVGDLLTTSATPGHAMRAIDRERAFGAVIGKALSSLERGTGMVEVLVTLT